MPNEMTSASESNSTPNALTVPVMRATRPSSMSRTMAKPMNCAAVLEGTAHRVDDAALAAEHVPEREQAGQQVHASPEPARVTRPSAQDAARQPLSATASSFIRSSVVTACPLGRAAVTRQTAQQRFSPRTVSPASPGNRALGRHEDVHARAEFHQAEAVSGASPIARHDAADHAPREHADDLAADDGAAVAIDPDLGALVLRAGLGPVGRQEAARLIGDAGDLPAVRGSG